MDEVYTRRGRATQPRRAKADTREAGAADAPHQILPQRFHLPTGAVGYGGLGAEAVRAQPWTATPATIEARRSVDPRVASRSSWARTLGLAMDRSFQVAYRAARKLLLLGDEAVFPAGTYWLHRKAVVAVENADPMPVFVVHGPVPIPIG